MAIISPIDLGIAPNTGTGDDARTAGQKINTNFEALNNDKLERGGYTGTAAQLARTDAQETFQEQVSFTSGIVSGSVSSSGPISIDGGTGLQLSTAVGQVNITAVQGMSFHLSDLGMFTGNFSFNTGDVRIYESLEVSGGISAQNLPTSSVGLASGEFWRDTTADNSIKQIP
ncbi:MAG: hypothetical protein AAF934_00050 [Bacteroidota bacterium]